METQNGRTGKRMPWSKGKLTGQTPPFKLSEIWAIRTWLEKVLRGRGRRTLARTAAGAFSQKK
jgi:hypothetical protein